MPVPVFRSWVVPVRGSCFTTSATAPVHTLRMRVPGSNAIGLFSGFVDDPGVALYGYEAGGDGVETGRHAAAITGGDPYKTTLQCWKYTVPAFLLPFMFVLDPAGLGLLLMGSTKALAKADWLSIAQVTATAAVGIAALAAGLSLIFGVMRLVNLVHGELVVLGAYLAYWVTGTIGGDPLVLLPVIAVVAAVKSVRNAASASRTRSPPNIRVPERFSKPSRFSNLSSSAAAMRSPRSSARVKLAPLKARASAPRRRPGPPDGPRGWAR